MERRCSCCKESNSRVGQSYCLVCHAAYMRAHRPNHSELTVAQRQRANARAYAKVYLSRGKLARSPCVKCGEPKSQMHHPDYSKPLVVVWLCRPCHLAEHAAVVS